MRLRAALLFSIGCSSAPSHSQPVPPPPPPSVDAAVAVVEPDAGIPQAVLDAPVWVFRYTTKDRKSIWGLQYADGHALLQVENAMTGEEVLAMGAGAPQEPYYGTAIADGDTIKIDVSTRMAHMTLDCKKATRPLSAKCNDKKAKPVDVLDCYHPDFKTPMTFGIKPGVEYVADASCTGFRLAK